MSWVGSSILEGSRLTTCFRVRGASLFGTWADHPSFGCLAAPEEIAGMLEEHGFGVVQRRNTTDLSAKRFAQAVEAMHRNGRPRVGVHRLMRADSDAKLVSMARNLIEDRIVVMRTVRQKEVISPRSATDWSPAEDRQ